MVNTPEGMNIYEAVMHAKKVYKEHGIFSGKLRYNGINVPFNQYSSYSDIEVIYNLLKINKQLNQQLAHEQVA